MKTYCPGSDYRSLVHPWPTLTLKPTKTRLTVDYKLIPVLVGLPLVQLKVLFIADKLEVGKPSHMEIPTAGCN